MQQRTFSNQAVPKSTRGTYSHSNQIAKALKASVLILAICSTIAFSIHPIPARSYRSTVPDGHFNPSVSGPSGTSLFVSPALLGNASLTPGMNVTISVFINNVTNLDAWEFKVKVDTSILKAVDADATPYWDTQQAQGKGSYLTRVNATAGTDFVYWVSFRQPNGVIPSLTTTVPFQLGTAKFQVLTSTKDTPFHIVTSQEDPNYGTILIDTNLNYIGYKSTDGAFANVRAPWDINWDLKVDIADLALVARSFGTTPGTPGWNLRADVNSDGRVDIADLTLVASHFGQNI